jgi:hypothetical protein
MEINGTPLIVGQVWECTQGHRHLIIDLQLSDQCPIKTRSRSLLGFWAWSAEGIIFDGPPEIANRLIRLIRDPNAKT